MARVPADQRRQDFIEAAVRVIAEQGMRGATTRRIAEAADAPLATLHYCFHTKEQLFFAVFEYMSASVLEQQVDVAPTENDLAATAMRIVKSTMEWSFAHQAYTKVQFDLTLWATRQEGKNAGLAARVYDLFFDEFTRVLDAAVGPGDDESIVRPLARLLIAILDGLSLQWISHHDAAQTRADVALACEMINAFLAAPRRSAELASPGRTAN
ncbi:TetR/AcrR family transcriptional regulator [Nocardia miyunensis]|uniref:TetR/AcrR family transcriptional regulator n=1 Tax=Nocardia miyunensis TaxID=282684 RepID=UPI00082BDD22|nr:TetR/AcrR family transcriptional regulator [Nocardia miyunensis]